LLQNGGHRESLEGSLPAESDGQTSWSKNQTRMLITYNKDNLIRWNKRLKDGGNKHKIVILFITRFEKTQPCTACEVLSLSVAN